MSKLSSKKFSELTEKRKHKHAARLLQTIVEEGEGLSLYRVYEDILKLPPVAEEKEALLSRIYLHEKKAEIPFPNQYTITTIDKESCTPFLEIDIYLEDLRSMHNIGAIMRSNEAFRLGTIFLSKELPPSALAKIKKTAMGTDSICKLHIESDLTKLKQPLIAIETAKEAKSIYSFPFPKSCTLLFGNEKTGLSKKALMLAEEVVTIPLFGKKNSLNVTAAFAILANAIRMQHLPQPFSMQC